MTLIEAKIGRKYWECDEWRRQTIANIIALDPALLVISQSDSVPGDQFTNGEWADATGKTLSTIKQAGVPVVFMLDTPQPALDIPECLAEHLGDVGACNSVGHLSDYDGRREDVQSVLGTIGDHGRRPCRLVLRRAVTVPGDRRQPARLPRPDPHDPRLQRTPGPDDRAVAGGRGQPWAGSKPPVPSPSARNVCIRCGQRAAICGGVSGTKESSCRCSRNSTRQVG